MILHSIRARITAWYATVLTLALVAAGTITYAVARQQIQRSTDASLASTVRNLTAGLVDEAGESQGALKVRSMNEMLTNGRRGRGESGRAESALDE